MSNNNRNFGDFLLGATLGAAVAGITALLLAPKSGDELREDIKKQTEKAKDTAQDYIDIAEEKGTQVWEDLKSSARDTAEDVKESAEDLGDKAKDTAEDVKESAEDLGEKAKDTAEDVGQEVKETAEDVGEEVKGSSSNLDKDEKERLRKKESNVDVDVDSSAKKREEPKNEESLAKRGADKAQKAAGAADSSSETESFSDFVRDRSSK